MKIRQIAGISFKVVLGWRIGKGLADYIVYLGNLLGDKLGELGRCKLKEYEESLGDPEFGEAKYTLKKNIRKILNDDKEVKDKVELGFH